MPRIATRAPTRMDFGGGWTDVPPYSTEQGGCVCNVAITRYASATVHSPGDPSFAPGGELVPAPERRTDAGLAVAALRRAAIEGLVLRLDSDFPVGAGLGGSSAAGVAAVGALAAWRGESLDRGELARRSRAIEVEDLGVPGGWQDHYAAAYGGALALRFADDTTVETIPLTVPTVEALERRCTIVYTGQSRISGTTITAVLDAYQHRDRAVMNALERMKQLAEQMAVALCAGDLDALGALVGEHWAHQRTLHPAITTPAIEKVMQEARAAGALGGKALGASGGGCVLVIAPDERADTVRRAAAGAGEVLSFRIDRRGFELLSA